MGILSVLAFGGIGVFAGFTLIGLAAVAYRFQRALFRFIARRLGFDWPEVNTSMYSSTMAGLFMGD